MARWVVAVHGPLGGVTETGNRMVASGIRRAVVNALGQLRRRSVLRWLVLIELATLMNGGLQGYLALYPVDAAALSATSAALGVAIWMGFGLLGDFLVIPMLNRVKGLTYLRFSALVERLLFVAFLLVPGLWPKLGFVALLGIGRAGWLAILKAQLYSLMPGQSGTVMAPKSVASAVGDLIPFGIGLAAGTWGLGTAMWLLLAGPAALLIGIPRHDTSEPRARLGPT